jgi:hypothetical protein
MAGIGYRSKIYTDAITVPTTKSAGSSLTLTSSELYPFEATGWGQAFVISRRGDTTKIGDTAFTTKAYVSFDEGDTGATWIQVSERTITRTGDTAGDAFLDVLPFAPRAKVTLSIGDTALTAGHGLGVDIEFHENDPEATRIFFDDVVDFGDSFATSGQEYISDALTVNSPNSLSIWYKCADASKVGDTAHTVTVETSLDGTNWVTSNTLSTAKPSNSTGIKSLTEDVTTKLSKYVRIKYKNGDTTVLDGHGMKYFVLAQE